MSKTWESLHQNAGPRDGTLIEVSGFFRVSKRPFVALVSWCQTGWNRDHWEMGDGRIVDEIGEPTLWRDWDGVQSRLDVRR